MDEPLFAASSAFSALGLTYFAVPVVVLLLAAKLLSRPVGGIVWPLISGAIVAMSIVVVVSFGAQRPQSLVDRHMAWFANLGACTGAILGVLAYGGISKVWQKLAVQRQRR